ncbi:MAG: ankyrin repeat domain-containing protein [Gemmatimonadaceae bacterium]
MLSLPADDVRAVQIVTAIQNGDVKSLQGQLRDSPDLAAARIVDEHGVSRTLLHVAADWPGHYPNGPSIIATLVTAGADVHAGVIHPGPHGCPETALHWAASSDDVGVLDALLDHGADIETLGAVFTGGTAMSDAVVFAQWRAARRLLERGATTTLWQAAALGLLERVNRFCMQTPPPPHEQITNAFWHACRGDQRAVAEYLLGRGADRNWIGHDHTTPLDAADEHGGAALVEWLVAGGAKRAAELR